MENTLLKNELFGTSVIKDYLSGGNAIVTLTSDSGVYHTYRFYKSTKSRMRSALFVETMVDNGEWKYVGMLNGGHFILTKCSKFARDNEIVLGVVYILKMMFKDGYHDDRMHLYHSGVCSVCGRRLVSPKSIQIGMGKECKRRVRNAGR